MNTHTSPQTTALRGISSKATQHLLAQLAAAYEAQTGQVVQIESVGGVDAAKRVAAGACFDVVLLASDAIDQLIASGHLVAPRVDWVRSPVAMAVPVGTALPNINNAAALKAALLAAPSISYSTGPSGNYLAKLFEQWGIAEAMSAKLIVPPPGTPVGSLVASGQAALGFQQLSEFLGVDGIQIVGNLPDEVAFITTFSAGVPVGASNATAFLRFLNASETASIKQHQGMSAIA
jgi:molybdate transport system substrate-binding protein